jgi:hypothetical protein
MAKGVTLLEVKRYLTPEGCVMATSKKADTTGQVQTEAIQPPCNPLVAAYEAGRLWNSVGWHAVQAWLTRDRNQYGITCQTFLELARKVREVVPVTERDGVQEHVQRQLHELWERCYAAEGRHEALWGASGRLQADLDNLNDYPGEREDLCAELSGTVERILDRTWEGIRTHFDVARVQAWYLGILVDRGIRPPAVYRHLWRDERIQPPGEGAGPFD